MCPLWVSYQPLEFAFLFVAPGLFIIHSFFAGIAYILTYILQINIPGPSSFEGPLLSFIFNGILNSNKGSHWYYLLIVGPIYFVLYYFTFKIYIEKRNLKTPGREEKTEDVKLYTKSDYKEKQENNEIAKIIIEGLGGKENIIKVENCYTRLRVNLKDMDKINEDILKTTKPNTIIKVDKENLQIVYGVKVGSIRNKVDKELGILN